MRLLLVLLGALTLVGCADDEEAQSSAISVGASGWVDATPDTLTLTITARATGEDVSALQTRVDQTTQAVAAAAGEAGVERDDIDSSRLSVQPEFEWQDRTRVYLGQSVQRDTVLTLRDIAQYGELIQALSALELHQISAPVLSHSDQDSLQLQAIDMAVKRATAQAVQVARSIDEELGEVLAVDVHTGGGAAPMALAMAEASPQRGAPQVQFGKQRISVSVSMRFAID